MHRCQEDIIFMHKGYTDYAIESGIKYLSKVEYRQNIGWYVKFTPMRYGSRTFTMINQNAENFNCTSCTFDIKYTELTDEDMDIRYYNGQLVTS